MTKELQDRLEEHAELIMDTLEDGEEHPMSEDQRKQLSDELRVTLQGIIETDKNAISLVNEETEYKKSKLTVGRAAVDIIKCVLPVVISGGVILTCHKWGYTFEENGLRKLSDVWRRMPNMKI